MCLSLIISVIANANINRHSVDVSVIKNSQQDSHFGVGIGYQWQFEDNLAFEGQLVSTGQLKKYDNSLVQTGDVKLLNLGGTLFKPYHNDITLSVSGGFSYTFDASNPALVEQNKISPYIKIGADMQLAPNWKLKVGHHSFFQGQQLANHHAIFVGVSYQFSSHSPATVVTSKPEKILTPSLKKSEDISTISRQPNMEVSPSNEQQRWRIQFGAFTQRANAESFLSKVSKLNLDLNISIEFTDKLFRVVSMPFNSKDDANTASKNLKSIAIDHLLKRY